MQTLAELHRRVQSLAVAQVNEYLRRTPFENLVVMTVEAEPLLLR